MPRTTKTLRLSLDLPLPPGIEYTKSPGIVSGTLRDYPLTADSGRYSRRTLADNCAALLNEDLVGAVSEEKAVP